MNELAIATGTNGGECTCVVEKHQQANQDHKTTITWETCSHGGFRTRICIELPSMNSTAILPIKWQAENQSILKCECRFLLSGIKRLLVSNSIQHLGQTWFHLFHQKGMMMELVEANDTDAICFPLRCYIRDVSHMDLNSFC
jgi:hypothetical protein